jgi:hypothetical protein
MFSLQLSLATFAASALAFQSLPMSGSQTGQLRVYNNAHQAESGCLTSRGRWTADETACGRFTAQDDGGVYVDTQYEKALLSSDAGPCWIDDQLHFACAPGFTETLWIHWPDFDDNCKSPCAP